MGFADSIKKFKEDKKKVVKESHPPVLSIEKDLVDAFDKSAKETYEFGVNKYRDDGWHPSQLSTMCPRYEVLRQLCPELLDKAIIVPDVRLQVIFDVGTAIHKYMQEQYFGPMGTLKGTWVCTKTSVEVEGTMPSKPSYAPNVDWDIQIGRNKFWTYREPPVFSKEWGVIGQSDGIYVLGKDSKYEEDSVLDIKTAGAYFWNSGAKAPIQSNVFQINLYMWLLGLKKGILLYVDKGGAKKKGLPFKEFIIEYNDGPRKEACELIEMYRNSVNKKKIPEKLAYCEYQPTGARAKNCPMKDVCMNCKQVSSLEKRWGDVRYI